jgi:hypothetical protein
VGQIFNFGFAYLQELNKLTDTAQLACVHYSYADKHKPYDAPLHLTELHLVSRPITVSVASAKPVYVADLYSRGRLPGSNLCLAIDYPG